MVGLNQSVAAEFDGSGVFVSRYLHNLDAKHRLTIPSEWRTQIGQPESLYVLPDVNPAKKCLWCFPAREMVYRLRKLREHSIADEKARQFARILGSQSDLVSFDTQGRIRIKDDLMAFAGLEDHVRLVGAIDHFELWRPEAFDGMGLDQSGLKDAAVYVGF